MSSTVDVVVIGMGPGGEAVAGRLAEAGLRVVGADARLVGGECPYYGCIPSKMMIRAANSLAEARRVPGLAGNSEVTPDFAPVAARIRAEATDNWDDQVAVDRFTGKGGRFVRGSGLVTGPGTVRVGDEEFTALRGIVLNTGTDPAVPPIPGLAGTPYWTNREAIAVESVPESVIVLGGGAIGLELAQVFARFGTHVSVVEVADRILPLEEPEASQVVAEVLTAEGLTLHTGVPAEAVAHDGARFTVKTAHGELKAEQLLVATGRTTDLAGLGLAAIGLDTNRRFVDPDEYLRIADGVYAIGDITGKGAFTHVSMYQAAIATRHILGDEGPGAEYHAVPRVTFTDPEVGAVGLTEVQARERGLDVLTATTAVPSSARGWIHKAGNEGVIKLVQDAGRGVLVGATSVGPHGGEVLSALALAVLAEVPVERLRQMMYAYPTFHRGIEDALSRFA
ncbi:NAD(P)/FAD-dependent oxidoreductase [Kribbella sp. NPDC026596]|uniref:dihydrolipoyl dehydrogenase family protein n=1 Tax=Kribbella sp. NPDC026596 TaxID=3155122 RepID=UPI0033CA7959